MGVAVGRPRGEIADRARALGAGGRHYAKNRISLGSVGARTGCQAWGALSSCELSWLAEGGICRHLQLHGGQAVEGCNRHINGQMRASCLACGERDGRQRNRKHGGVESGGNIHGQPAPPRPAMCSILDGRARLSSTLFRIKQFVR